MLFDILENENLSKANAEFLKSFPATYRDTVSVVRQASSDKFFMERLNRAHKYAALLQTYIAGERVDEFVVAV